MFNKRIVLLMEVFLLVFSFLLLRCFYYQIVRGTDISRKTIAMHSQKIDMRESDRGDFLDRNLLALTNASDTAALYCLPQSIPVRNGSPVKSCREIAHYLAANLNDIKESDVLDTLEKAAGQRKAIIKLHSDLSPAEVEKIRSSQWSCLVIAPISKRYRQDGFLAHLIGYVSTVGQEEGQAGLEKTYDQLLQKGGTRQELNSIMDARGQAIPGIQLKVTTADTKKNAVVLTIDKRIQELVEKTMNQRVAKGAVVVMDVRNKEILAMASRPAFNQYQVEEYLSEDIDSTLTNRALSAYYPGSLFKIVVSIAALQNKIVRTDDEFICTGKYEYNNQLATACWKEGGHGKISFAGAFANSCNPTFIRVGISLGRARLLQQVAALHLTDNKIIGGDQMNAATYVKIDGGDAALGNVCLGQQGVMLTPLQIASLLATVADDGYWAPPSILKYTLDSNGIKHNPALKKRTRVIDVQTNRQVQRMMEKVVAEGTGQAARLSEVKIAGKTATSQTGNIRKDGEEILNTWFAGYLPAEEPRWAIVVLVEEGKSGAENCAPVFKDISQGMLEISP